MIFIFFYVRYKMNDFHEEQNVIFLSSKHPKQLMTQLLNVKQKDTSVFVSSFFISSTARESFVIVFFSFCLIYSLVTSFPSRGLSFWICGMVNGQKEREKERERDTQSKKEAYGWNNTMANKREALNTFKDLLQRQRDK